MNISTSNLLQEISEVLELIDDTIFESMYTDNTDFTSIEFCELAKISKKNNLLLVIKDSAWGYLSNGCHTDIMEISITLAEPCCLSHALELLTRKFQDQCEEIYGEIPECRYYYMEGLELESISEDSINIEIITGT